MKTPPEPKGTSTILFEAGELLREEVREKIATLTALVNNSTSGEWAAAARKIGRADFQWPVELIDTLNNMERYRLKGPEIERIKQYIEKKRSAAGYL